MIDTQNPKFKLRFAEEVDAGLILSFIQKLAEYEEMSDQVVATKESILKSIFVQKAAEVIIGEYDNEPVCFALFFHNYSTFLGQAGIYLEDLYVDKKHRGKGLGTLILSYLATLAVERDCGRLEWACLDWNEPSIAFYKGIGAVSMDDWTVYRLTGDKLKALANR